MFELVEILLLLLVIELLEIDVELFVLCILLMILFEMRMLFVDEYVDIKLQRMNSMLKRDK